MSPRNRALFFRQRLADRPDAVPLLWTTPGFLAPLPDKTNTKKRKKKRSTSILA